MAAVLPKTPTIAVPCVPRYCEERPKDVIRRNASLTIRRTGQGNLHRRPTDDTGHLSNIADGIDVGIVRLHVRIRDDATARSAVESCFHGEPAFRADANADNCEIHRQSFFRAQMNVQRRVAVVALRKRFGRIIQPQVDSLISQMLFQRANEFRVPGRQNLIGEFNNRDMQTTPREVFSHFDADESGSDDQRVSPSTRCPSVQNIGVGEIPQREHVRTVDSRNRRSEGRRSRGNDQLVILFFVRLARDQIRHGNGFRIAIDPTDF